MVTHYLKAFKISKPGDQVSMDREGACVWDIYAHFRNEHNQHVCTFLLFMEKNTSLI